MTPLDAARISTTAPDAPADTTGLRRGIVNALLIMAAMLAAACAVWWFA